MGVYGLEYHALPLTQNPLLTNSTPAHQYRRDQWALPHPVHGRSRLQTSCSPCSASGCVMAHAASNDS